MSARSAGFDAVIDTLGDAQGDKARTGFWMLDGSDGPARLAFRSGRRRRSTAEVGRWLAIVRAQAPAGSATTVVWVLDGRTTRWSGGLPPGDLHRGVTGLDSETAPILWFRAGDCAPARHGFAAAGVFGAAGIVDAAQMSAARRRMSRQVRLRVAIDPRMWDLSASPAGGLASATRRGRRLTITASGVPRTLDLDAVRRWL